MKNLGERSIRKLIKDPIKNNPDPVNTSKYDPPQQQPETEQVKPDPVPQQEQAE